MVGSSDSISCANIMLNAAVAEALRQFADRLEGCKGDFDVCLHDLIKETISAHKRILFNGNGYDEAWIKEAVEERGLLNLRTTPDAMQMVLHPENIEMLTRHKIFSEAEIRSRYETSMENYVRIVHIEALTMLDMTQKEILPAIIRYVGDLSASLNEIKKASSALPCRHETRLIERLGQLIDSIDEAADCLSAAVASLDGLDDSTAQAFLIRDELLGKMDALRALCDEAETLTAASYWPFPTYGELLFGVK